MIELILEPRKGVGPLKFGMDKAALRKAAASCGLVHEPTNCPSEAQDFFSQSNVLVEYMDGTVSFIGIAANEAMIGAFLRGQNLLGMSASAALNHAWKGEISGKKPRIDDNPILQEQIVTFWDAAQQYDRMAYQENRAPRRMWGQVGLGDARYLSISSQT